MQAMFQPKRILDPRALALPGNLVGRQTHLLSRPPTSHMQAMLLAIGASIFRKQNGQLVSCGCRASTDASKRSAYYTPSDIEKYLNCYAHSTFGKATSNQCNLATACGGRGKS